MSDHPRLTFEEVAHQLTEPLRGFLISYLGDRDLADDLLQEVLVRIEANLAGFRGEASVKTWAFRIATNAVIDHSRRKGAGTTVVSIDEVTSLSDDSPDIDAPLITQEMNSCIREQIDSLPEDYRFAIVLHDLQGLTAGEVAAICGTSLATAKIRIHRARLRLREVLTDSCGFYYDDDLNLQCDRKAPPGEE